jgi:putative transposase
MHVNMHCRAMNHTEGGVSVSELCREHGMSNASFYKWLAKFDGMHCPTGIAEQSADRDASLICETKDLAEQDRRLKTMYAEMSMQNHLLKEAL